MNIMTDPVMALDGHSYERNAIEEWFRRTPGYKISPKTNMRINSTLIPNYGLKSLIESYIKTNPNLDQSIINDTKQEQNHEQNHEQKQTHEYLDIVYVRKYDCSIIYNKYRF
jgi:hypothetical protein